MAKTSTVKKRPTKKRSAPKRSELKATIDQLQKDPTPDLLRQAIKYIPYYLKCEGLTKKLLKEAIVLWAEAGEKVRVLCLLCIIRVLNKLQSTERKQLVIKKLYTSFLDKCRITKQDTMAMIGFMRYSLLELFKLFPDIAFKQAQSSCQQLGIALKNAYTHKNEESYKSILNWQYANRLILMSDLVAAIDDKNMRSLANQVIQLNLQSICLLTSPRYYPYYCHLIENLIKLSASTNLFIPILPSILMILKRLDIPLDKKVKKVEDPKEYNMDLLNHVNLTESHSHEYQVAVLDKVCHLLLYYSSSQCHRIAFPELVLLPTVQIKKWLKKNPGQPSQRLKNLLDKIKSDSEKVDELRKSVDFGFSDYVAVDAWERGLRDSNKLSLPILYEREKQKNS